MPTPVPTPIPTNSVEARLRDALRYSGTVQDTSHGADLRYVFYPDTGQWMVIDARTGEQQILGGAPQEMFGPQVLGPEYQFPPPTDRLTSAMPTDPHADVLLNASPQDSPPLDANQFSQQPQFSFDPMLGFSARNDIPFADLTGAVPQGSIPNFNAPPQGGTQPQLGSMNIQGMQPFNFFAPTYDYMQPNAPTNYPAFSQSQSQPPPQLGTMDIQGMQPFDFFAPAYDYTEPPTQSSAGNITDNPFADPTWTTPTSDSSLGEITDNPFANPDWLPQSSDLQAPNSQLLQAAYDPLAQGSIGQQGGVPTVKGTVVLSNGNYGRFDPATGGYFDTGVRASGTGFTGGFGVGVGPQFGVTSAGFSTGYTPFGGGGVGPQFSGGGYVDTSAPYVSPTDQGGLSHGGFDPTGGGTGAIDLASNIMAMAMKIDAGSPNVRGAIAVSKHGGG